MGNARVYKAADPASPDPNNLQMMPSDALIAELLKRFADVVVVTRYEGEHPLIHYWCDTELSTYGLLKHSVQRMERDW